MPRIYAICPTKRPRREMQFILATRIEDVLAAAIPALTDPLASTGRLHFADPQGNGRPQTTELSASEASQLAGGVALPHVRRDSRGHFDAEPLADALDLLPGQRRHHNAVASRHSRMQCFWFAGNENPLESRRSRTRFHIFGQRRDACDEVRHRRELFDVQGNRHHAVAPFLGILALDSPPPEGRRPTIDLSRRPSRNPCDPQGPQRLERSALARIKIGGRRAGPSFGVDQPTRRHAPSGLKVVPHFSFGHHADAMSSMIGCEPPDGVAIESGLVASRLYAAERRHRLSAAPRVDHRDADKTRFGGQHGIRADASRMAAMPRRDSPDSSGRLCELPAAWRRAPQMTWPKPRPPSSTAMPAPRARSAPFPPVSICRHRSIRHIAGCATRRGNRCPVRFGVDQMPCDTQGMFRGRSSPGEDFRGNACCSVSALSCGIELFLPGAGREHQSFQPVPRRSERAKNP